MKDITFQSVFDTPTVKMGNLNSKAMTPDGRIWTYLKATEIISQYCVTERPVQLSVDTVATSQNAKGQNVFVLEASAGWTVGAYQDHWMVVNDGTNEGQVAKIKDNTKDTLELYEDYALATALTVAASDDIEIVHMPDAELMDTSGSVEAINGVAQVAFAALDYGWFLIKGIGGIMVGDTAGEIDEPLVPGDDTAGYANGCGDDVDVEDKTIIGTCLVANTTADKATLAMINII